MQQNTSAMWAAIILLAAVAGVFGVMSFQAQQEIHNLNDRLTNSDPSQLASTYNNNKVRDMIQLQLAFETKERKYIDTISGLRDQVTALQQDLERQLARTQFADNQVKQAEQRHDNLVAQHAEDKQRDQANHATQLAQARADAEAAMAQSVEAQKTIIALTDEKNNNQDALNTLHSRNTLLHDELDKVLRDNRTRVTPQDQAVGVQVNATVFDGEILHVDLKNNLVQINLGSVNKVSPKMRFQVVRRLRNELASIATIEITKVDRLTSEAVILIKTKPRKMCALTGWITDDPNALYSPFTLRRQQNENGEPLSPDDEGYQELAQRLIDIAPEDISTMDPLNPVMAGDKIMNPLYTPDKTLHFAHVGETVFELSLDMIQSVIKEYGGVFDDEVLPTTDYVVLSYVPTTADLEQLTDDADPAVRENMKRLIEQQQKAITLGIPVIREKILLDFLAK